MRTPNSTEKRERITEIYSHTTEDQHFKLMPLPILEELENFDLVVTGASQEIQNPGFHFKQISDRLNSLTNAVNVLIRERNSSVK